MSEESVFCVKFQMYALIADDASLRSVATLSPSKLHPDVTFYARCSGDEVALPVFTELILAERYVAAPERASEAALRIVTLNNADDLADLLRMCPAKVSCLAFDPTPRLLAAVRSVALTELERSLAEPQDGAVSIRESCVRALGPELYLPGRIERPALVECCAAFSEEVARDVMLCRMDTVPFGSALTPPTVYMQSDGGHGGMAPISFCPFCGKKIEFVRPERR